MECLDTKYTHELKFELFQDRIVVSKLTADAKFGDPSDDVMFIGPRCESWKDGPVWMDYAGNTVRENRWIIPTDAGWVHYFADRWTLKERFDVWKEYLDIFA